MKEGKKERKRERKKVMHINAIIHFRRERIYNVRERDREERREKREEKKSCLAPNEPYLNTYNFKLLSLLAKCLIPKSKT
jgi:hypothetical protein